MAYNALNNLIDAYIYANGVQAITGQILNGVLKQMVSQLGSGYHLMGVAGPGTIPEQNDYAMAYFAATAGEYTDFGGITLAAGEVAVLLTYGNGSWAKQTIYNVPTDTADLENTAGFITNAVTDLVNYYTKTEMDTTLADYPTLQGLATALADYYTKTEIDGQMGDVDAALADRYTKSETDTKLADYYKKTETYDKDEVDSIVAALSRQEYIVAWDGTTAPDVSAIPAAVTVTYSGTPYTGTLDASASTVNKIYMVWNGTAYDMYGTSQDGGYSWVPMGTTTVDLSQYATKAEVNQLEAEVDGLEEEVLAINPHITGRMGIGNTNEDVNPSDLQLYTGQYGIVTLVFNEDGYLWCCLENNNFRVSAHGVEVPMNYVKEDGDLHCFVSAEKIKAGVMQFVVEGIHPIKADSERVIITARSYTITYGDEMPDFGFIADGEVEGTPSITCEAVQGSNVGTYAIVISRGTVEDDNAIYVNGTLTIVKAELTITAEDKQVAVGGTMPTFTVQYSGFVLGEDASDLTTQPTCTTNAQGTSTEGFYTITPSGAVSDNYSFVYVDGVLKIGDPSIVAFSVEQIDASGSCGGYLAPADGKYLTSTEYYGILIDVRNYRGMRIVFTKNTTTGNWGAVRFAFLKTAILTNNVRPAYSSESGFTDVVTQTYPEGVSTLEYIIPSDASYLFLYTYSQGYNSRASNISIHGAAPQIEAKNLYASLFAANTTIGADGSVYTGPDQKVVCSDYLDAAAYAYCGDLQVIVNSLPSNVSLINMNVAEYDGNKKFIRRDTYAGLPSTFTLAPSCSFVRLMAVQKDMNGNNLAGDVAYFDGDDIQSIGTNQN